MSQNVPPRPGSSLLWNTKAEEEIFDTYYRSKEHKGSYFGEETVLNTHVVSGLCLVLFIVYSIVYRVSYLLDIPLTSTWRFTILSFRNNIMFTN